MGFQTSVRLSSFSTVVVQGTNQEKNPSEVSQSSAVKRNSITLLLSDHRHFLVGWLSSVVMAAPLTAGRGGVDGYGVEGDEANKDDHQRHHVQT